MGRMRLVFAVVKLLIITAAIVVAGFFVLTQVFGMRVEMAGSGMRPVFTFHDQEAHYEAIERDRREAAKRTPPPSARAEPASPETVASAEGVAEEPKKESVTEAPAPVSAPWPDYRGASREGIYTQTPIRTDWPDDGLEELWRQKVGGGYASMVVAEGLVFTIEQRRDHEVVAAYDLESGHQVWEHGWPALFEEQMGGPGPRATPTWSDGKLYAQGATGELRCLRAANGELLWKTNILEDAGASNAQWGMPASPLIHRGMVVVNPGGSAGKSVAAYDAETGEIIWQSHDNPAGYSSPMIGTLTGREQLIVFTGDAALGINLSDGAPLWNVPWGTQFKINAAQPVAVDEDHLLIASGYGQGAALLQVLADGDSLSTKTIWQKNTLKSRFNSPVLFEGHVYGFDESIMACIDVRTGERKWKGGRYGYGQVLLADGHLIVLSEKGEVVLVKATPESHQELARFSALEGKTWNVPAIADGKLLVRNQTEMAAYRLGL